MSEAGETFQIIKSALSFGREDTEAEGVEVSPHPGPIAGVLIEPGRLQWAPHWAWGPDLVGPSTSAYSRGGSRPRGSVPSPGDRELKPRSSGSVTCGETDTGLCCSSPEHRLVQQGKQNVGWGWRRSSRNLRAADVDPALGTSGSGGPRRWGEGCRGPTACEASQ